MTLFGKEVNKEGLKVFWQNLKTSSHKRTLGILFFAVLVLSIPVTVTLVGQQQDLRQRAEGTKKVTSVYCIDGPFYLPDSSKGIVTNVFCLQDTVVAAYKASNKAGWARYDCFNSFVTPRRCEVVQKCAYCVSSGDTSTPPTCSSCQRLCTGEGNTANKYCSKTGYDCGGNPIKECSDPPPQPPNKPNSSTNNPLLNNAKKATPTPIPTYNISGKVFYDKDMNSSYATSERLYLGQDQGQATVYLYGPVNKITRTSGGRYSFTGIPVGNYEVRLDLPDFYKATSGKCNAVGCRDKTSMNTTVGPSKSNIDFGVIALYRISGKVYVGNTSTGYNGATVKLYDAATNKLYSAVQTDKNGNYDFGKIPAIRWEVRPTVPSGYRNTTLTARNLVLQKDRTDINFGLAKKSN